ncbi:MAG: hypothetical protein MK095_06465, partial [Phycisphaerales bacterium]|nr:hypothetical protein [Phycisphaerales bacterium]
EKSKQHQNAHKDDPSLLKFTVDDGFGGRASTDLIPASGAELGIVPYVGAARGAVGALVITAKAF